MKRRTFILLVLMIAMVFAMGCEQQEANEQQDAGEQQAISEQENIEEEKMTLEQLKAPKSGEALAVFHTNKGDITFRLFPEIAPKTVENFTTHIKDGYYDGVIFHRVINEFMIQGGDPTGTGRGGESIWGQPFEDEFDVNYRNFRGALSMANAGPATNGSQFFIVQAGKFDANIIDQMREAGPENGYPDDVVNAYEKLGGTFHLDGKHTVFGQVVEGMDVVDAIAKVDTDGMDKPLEDVIIESAELITAP